MREYEGPTMFTSFAKSPTGNGIWGLLNEPRTMDLIYTASKLGHPALNALDDVIFERFGEAAFTNEAKRATGNMVYQVIRDAGGRLIKTSVKCRQPCRYTSGARYSFDVLDCPPGLERSRKLHAERMRQKREATA